MQRSSPATPTATFPGLHKKGHAGGSCEEGEGKEKRRMAAGSAVEHPPCGKQQSVPCQSADHLKVWPFLFLVCGGTGCAHGRRDYEFCTEQHAPSPLRDLVSSVSCSVMARRPHGAVYVWLWLCILRGWDVR